MATKAGKPLRQKSAPTSPGSTAIQISLPQMLDLALGTPEVGAVNFNILHNFLHVVLHQINLRTTKVEYRGDDANRIKTMVASVKGGPSLHLHEYSIIDGSGRVKQRIHSNENLTVNVDIYTDGDLNAKASRGSSSAPSTARGTKSTTEMETGTGAKNVKGVKQQISGRMEKEFESVIFVEPVIDGATPTTLSFKKLENSVQKLQRQFQVLEELATNQELINQVKGNSTDPLTDMWQIINIKKRLDASEQGISKLTSMLQDLIKSDKISGPDVSTQLTEIDQRLSNLEESVALFFEKSNSSPPDIQQLEPNTTDSKSNSKPEATLDEPEKKEMLENPNTEEKEIGVQNLTENSPKDSKEILADVAGLKKDITQVRNDIAELKTKLGDSSGHDPRSEGIKFGEVGSKKDEEQTGPGTESGGGTNKNIGSTSSEDKKGACESPSGEKNLKEAHAEEKEKSGNTTPVSAEREKGANDEKLVQCLEAVKNLETEINELNTRVEELKKDTARLMGTANNLPMNGLSSDSGQIINELHTKIQSIQDEMEKLNQTNSKIIEDKENLNTNTNILQEQIELLRIVKADKEDLEDALANKADANTVKRKVSYDQFDATCDDLTRGLEEALGKLNQQESFWQQTLEEVQKEIECKLDKEEIPPFKESVDNKFNGLQNQLKALTKMKEPNEAAATKKMLRDVQCLSCDKDVVMRMHENAPIYAPAIRCDKSMKPYLTYELDQIRKQKNKFPQSKNMLHLEAAVREDKKLKAKGSILANDSKSHLCNRYCGGSHTIITPQQKVMRVGHFIDQWGPQVIQLSGGLIKGSDGQIYHGRLMVDEPNGKQQKICEPCDNKCSSQQTSKENLAPEDNLQSIQRKGSYVSEAKGEQVDDKASIGSQGKVSKQSNEMTLSEDSPPPPSPSRNKLLENKQQDTYDLPESAAKTIGVGSFFEESKSIAKIAFEEEEIEEVED